MKNYNEPLKGNPKRQASYQLGGYIYQIWQSVYAWINLGENDLLCLEIAEDLDIVSKSGVKTFQIKHKKSSLTLRSPEIVEAISNYWELCINNNTRKIEYFLLTTSTKGFENGRPFGEYKGLDYWDMCKSGLENVNPLRKFLLEVGKDKFSSALYKFIKEREEKYLLEKLIKPITWSTSQINMSDIKEKVKGDLILLGEQLRVRPFETEQAVLFLKDHLENIICSKNVVERVLNRVDLLKAFELATTIRITSSDLGEMQNSIFQKVLNAIQNKISSNSSIVQVPDIEKVPDLRNSKLIQRESLISLLNAYLRKYNLLIIRGSTGMGKSTISKLIVQSELDSWKLINLRGYNPTAIRNFLNNLNKKILHESVNLIIDDISFDGDNKIFIDILERVIFNIISNGNRLIINTQHEIPFQIISNLNIQKESLYLIPRFSEYEIKEMLIMYKCPNDQLNLWIKDVSLLSRGHPLLVHARIKALNNESWPKNKVFFDTSEIKTVKQEIRKQLIAQLSSEDVREMAFRLSILSGGFKRENALSLANFPTQIKSPGAIFDQLIGPFVEKVTDKDFQLTPLLDDAAIEVYGKGEVFEKLHAFAGVSYITKTLSPNDLSNILLHGILAKSGFILSRACEAFQSIKSEYRKIIYPYLEWFIWINIEPGKKLFEEDENLSMMLRYAQLNIAAVVEPQKAIVVAEAWESEVVDYKGKTGFGKAYPKESKFIPLMFYLNVFTHLNLPFPVKKYSQWVCDVIAFINSNPEVQSLFLLYVEKQTGQKEDLRSYAIQTLLTKKIGISEFGDLLSILQQHPQGKYVLGVLNSNFDLYSRLSDNILLGEMNKQNPDWKGAIEMLNKLTVFAESNNAKNIVASAYREISIIEKEYLNNTAAASKTLSAGKKKVGSNNQALLNYEAKMFFIDKNYSQALKIWNDLLPKWQDAKGLTRAFSYRDAGVCAAYLDDWDLASRLARSSAEDARLGGNKTYEQQCMADYASSLWKKGDIKNSLIVFSNILEKIQTLPDPKYDLQVLGLVKMLANVFIWILRTVNPKYKSINTNNVDPYPGIFSNLEFSEELKKLPMTTPIALWTFLADIEYQMRNGDSIYKKMESYQHQMPLLFKTEKEKILVSKHIHEGNINNLVKEIGVFYGLTRLSFNTANNHQIFIKSDIADLLPFFKDGIELITMGISFALLGFLKNNNIKNLPIAMWKKHARELMIDKETIWKDWINLASRLPELSQHEINEIMKDGNSHAAARSLAALFTLTQDNDPNAHFYASVILANCLDDRSFWIRDVEENLEKLISKRWIDIVEKQRFSLNSPSLNCPSIKSASNNTAVNGLQKVANIIMAARYAVDVKLSDSIVERIAKMANE